MRQLIIFIILASLISCKNSKQPEKVVNKQIEKRITKITPIVFNSESDSSVYQVREELLKNRIDNPETYKSISWSKVELLDNPIFKYRVIHRFLCSDLEFKTYDNRISEYEMYFHLDSTGKIVASTLKKEYLKYYTNDGQFKALFSGFEFEKIAKDNRFDMLLQSENSKTIQVVSALAPIFKGKVGMTKNEFLKENFQKLDKNILLNIDTVDYCVDMSGEDCKLYIFENDTIKEILNAL